MVLISLLARGVGFIPSVLDPDESLYLLQAREWLRGGWPYVAVWDMHPVGAPGNHRGRASPVRREHRVGAAGGRAVRGGDGFPAVPPRGAGAVRARDRPRRGRPLRGAQRAAGRPRHQHGDPVRALRGGRLRPGPARGPRAGGAAARAGHAAGGGRRPVLRDGALGEAGGGAGGLRRLRRPDGARPLEGADARCRRAAPRPRLRRRLRPAHGPHRRSPSRCGASCRRSSTPTSSRRCATWRGTRTRAGTPWCCCGSSSPA